MKAADAAALVAPLAIGVIGSIPTARAIPTWYRTLDKPSWNPPNVVFGPVWTTLYALMGVALVLVRRAPAEPATTRRAEAIFALQLSLNLAWSFVFFGSHDLRGAVAVIGLLWITIFATIVEFSHVRRLAAALLVPYLAWVSFAAVLNADIAPRNPGPIAVA
jgi:translocator protein